MRKKQLLTSLIVALMATYITGCKYIDLKLSKKPPATSTIVHHTIALRKTNSNPNKIFIQISNYTNLNGAIVKSDIIKILQDKHYKIILEPKNADYLLQLNIVKQEPNKAIFGTINVSEKIIPGSINNTATTDLHITSGSSRAQIITTHDDLKWRRYSSSFISKINNDAKFKKHDNIMEKLLHSLATKIGEIF